MENQASKIVFFKSRSLAGRFSSAFDFIENNLKVLVKLSSFILVPTAFIVAFLFTTFSNLMIQAFQAKSAPTVLLTKYLILLLSIVLISIIGDILFKGLLFLLVKEYSLRDSIARLSFKGIKDKLILNTKRFFIVSIVLFVFMIIYFALFAGLFILSKWTLLLTVPLVLFLMIPFTYAQVIYMFEELNVMAALKKGFKLGIPNWAGTFFLLILATVFSLIIQTIAFTPWGIGLFAESLSFNSILDGNPSTLPGYFSFLMFVLCVIGFFISYLAQTLPSMSMIFQYFSASKKQADKEEQDQSL